MVYNAALSRRVVRVRIPSGPQKEIQQQVSNMISSILILAAINRLIAVVQVMDFCYFKKLTIKACGGHTLVKLW